MDCFHDFCLFCDRESLDGHYCSQACKLADLERSTASAASSPTTQAAPGWTTSPALSRTHTHAHSTDRKPSYTSPSSTSQRDGSQSYHRYPQSASPPQHDAALDRYLSPSSSRTSLSSTLSSSANVTPDAGLSAQAQHHLHDYFSSFDQVRAAKRRSSTR